MRETVTLNHVAREAGVSPSTVSRVINGTAQVAPEKHKAVLEAIQRLGYSPNVLAKGLAQGKSLSIGVVTQEISSPFYGEILKGIEQGLDGSPYHPIFASGHWRADREKEALRVLSGRRVDAMIVLDGLVPERELILLAKSMPIIVIGRRIKGMERHCLDIDHTQGAYMGTRHLIELGHSRIAHISGPLHNKAAHDRYQGYKKAVQEAGLQLDLDLVVEGNFTEQSGVLAMDALFSKTRNFTAIIGANDQMAFGAKLALYRRGIRVPHDISLVGFDDLPGCSYITPPLTTVRFPTLEFGREAARVILLMLENRPYTLHNFQSQLIVRESTALLR